MAPQCRDLIQQLNATNTDSDTKLRVVRILKNEIIGSQNKKQCYLELGAVPKIVQLLAAQQDKKLTVQAAATLGSFAYNNEAGVKAVVESGGISHLLKTLSSEDEKVVEAGVRSLKMIFHSTHSPQDVIFVHPAFDRLVTLLSHPKKTFAEDAAMIFAKCCRSKLHQEQLTRSGALANMSRLLVTQTPNRQAAALEALVSMSRQNGEVCEKLLSMPGVKIALLSFTRDQTLRLRLTACSVLTNVIRNLSTETKSLLTFREQKQILQVLARLLDEAAVQERVPNILATLTEDRADLQRAAYEVDAVKKLCSFLTSSNEMDAAFQVGVLCALASISQHLPECRQQIIEYNAVQAIIACLSSNFSDVRATAAFCIQNMTATVNDLNYEWVAPAVDPLILLLKDDDTAVKIKACAALCNLLCEFRTAKTACMQQCLHVLAQFTQSDEPQLVCHSAWAFKNLTHNLPNQEHLTVLKEINWLQVQNLIRHPDSCVQASALTFLQNVCSSDSDSIQTVIDWSAGALLNTISDKLTTIQECDVKVVAAALCVVSNISTGTAEHRAAVMDSGMPSKLLACLRDARSEKTRSAAAWCVINLIWRDELPLNDGSDGARDRAMHLRNIGIETELRKMQGDDSLDVRERVQTALGFFSE